jgi:hypothetical protein
LLDAAIALMERPNAIFFRFCISVFSDQTKQQWFDSLIADLKRAYAVTRSDGMIANQD